MYEEDRDNREHDSEAGYSDRTDEHMEYRSEASRREENPEIRSEQHLTQEGSQNNSAWQSVAQESSQNNSAWQSAPQGNNQNSSAWQSASQGDSQSSSAWQSAPQGNSQNSSAWQPAPQGDSQSSSAWQSTPQGSAASWSAQGSAQDSRQADAQAQEQHHTTGGWAPRRPEFHHASHQRPEHTKRSGRSLAGKIAGVTAAAVLFGTVAGGTMFAVDTAGEYLKGQYTTIGQTETQAQVKVAQDDDGSSTTAGAPVTSAIQTDVSSIVEKAMPSVVAINNTMVMQQQTWFGPSQTVEVPSSGSGIIVGQNDEELLIVTNNHVVADSKELTVTFIDNSQVSAAIKGTDSETDLAVIAIPLKDIPSDTMSQIKVATLGDSDALKVGQGVIAIGNALGYGQSVTVGYVSALNREVKAEDQTSRTLLQTDAAINPGNSGGALLNMKGEVIGINAAKYSSTEVEGMGYAIPISQAQDIINELMNKKTRVAVDEAEQGYLGIQGQNIDETAASMYGMPRGIYVYKIVEDSAASQSDLREKDIITKFDGQTVRTMADLKDMLTYYKGGDTVNLTVQSLENGQYVERTVQITLGTKPAGETN
ncbi:trypsin-like peptidase domain-containing protein [Ventrimonas sp. CLA-AP-H27]|uniref:Trypsin-like peptidase domain-containing protein n=1 Tax=Ventrimonas faecis TaxID=3133170 RepID=A0ABV1HMS8_9FIRM